MKHSMMLLLVIASGAGTVTEAQSTGSCANLASLKLDRGEISKAELVPAGFIVPSPYPGAPSIGPLPVHCRVEGEEFGIGFAIALPDDSSWNREFVMQGGGGGNGVVSYPAGASYADDQPALARGFAVASTDTGHKSKTGAPMLNRLCVASGGV